MHLPPARLTSLPTTTRPANLAGVYPEAEFTYSARMLPPAVSSSTGKQAKEAEVEVRCRAADDSGNLAATVSRHFPI